MPLPPFIFVTCQVGAEPAVKADLTHRVSHCRLSFSRPGFLTFKLPADHDLAEDTRLPCVFVRSHGFCLGKVAGVEPADIARQVWGLVGERAVEHIHVFERDRDRPGEGGYEPTITPLACEVHDLLRRSHSQPERIAKVPHSPRQPAHLGRQVLDCVLVEPDQWWIGYHRVCREESRWPGGIIPLEMPDRAVSRAWLKMEEALRWSRLPIRARARVAEIGSAPGGAAQALLDRGCEVLGVDPAEMDPRVLSHPRFTHLRGRAREIRRREFRKVRWLVADMNVAPHGTLDVVEDIVSHPQVHIRGMLLTLKLAQLSLAEQLPEWTLRIRSWGYNVVRARQLVHNRQELCVAALMQPFRRT